MITSSEASTFSSRTPSYFLWLGHMTCFFSGPHHLYSFVSNLRLSRRTLVTSIWPAFSVGLVVYIVSSVTHVRQGGLLLHPSVTYIRQGRILLLVTLPYPLKGFRCLDRLVGNVHPSRRNLVTCYFALST